MSGKKPSRQAIDLVAFAESLPGERRALAGAIMALRDAQSARTDLNIAFDFVISLREMRELAMHAAAGHRAENCALALMYSAIVLYARATKSESDHRRTFDPRSKFDDAEKHAHSVLCGLRDDAIAHFGPGHPYTGPTWQADGVFLVPPNGQIMTASRRLVIVPGIIDLLERQVHRALMIADREVQTRNSSLADALIDLSTTEPALYDGLGAFEVDLAQFFDDAVAAQDILSGSRHGYRRGTSRQSE